MPIARIEIFARRHQRIVAAPFAEYSVIQVRAGRKRITDSAGVTEIDAGGYFAVAPGSLLHVENLPADDGPYRAVCLCITRDQLGEHTRATDEASRSWAVLPPQTSLAQAFAHAEQGLTEGLAEPLLRHRVAELLTAVALAGFRPQLEHSQRISERVRLLLNTRPDYEWRTDEVARQLAVSPATLRRRLAEEQSGFREVLEEVRLTHGLALVQGTTKPMKRVAAECGYASPSRFTARFRERFGSTPSELRG
ncbi:MAG: helix-turn-helix transcriptional regulator [Rhodanobacter sp.]